MINQLPEEKTVIIHKEVPWGDSLQQFLLTYNSRAFVISPGSVGTYNKFLDIWDAMQTKTIRRKPVILLGEEFFQGVIDEMDRTSRSFVPKLITDYAMTVPHVVNTSQDVLLALQLTSEENIVERYKPAQVPYFVQREISELQKQSKFLLAA